MPEKSSLDLYCYSKVLCEFFNKELKVPYSPKKKLTIPDYILENELYLRRFLRGLFDTDGCTTISRTKGYSYRLIKISNISLDFAKEINLAYSFLGIRSYICNKNPGYDITIRRKESFKRFMELIEPKNN
jgi:intein/homing endonuclease